MEKKMIEVGKGMIKVVDGKLVCASEEVLNAIANDELNLYVSEEEAGVFGNCFGCNKDSFTQA